MMKGVLKLRRKQLNLRQRYTKAWSQLAVAAVSRRVAGGRSLEVSWSNCAGVWRERKVREKWERKFGGGVFLSRIFFKKKIRKLSVGARRN